MQDTHLRCFSNRRETWIHNESMSVRGQMVDGNDVSKSMGGDEHGTSRS